MRRKPKIAKGHEAGSKTHILEFEDMADLLRTAADYDRTAEGRSNSAMNGEASWAGSSTVETAISTARTGWPEGLEKIAKARRGLPGLTAPRSIIPCPTIAEDGDEILVDRFLDGESDCWLDFPQVEKSVSGRIIPIIVNLAVSCGVDKSKIEERGALVVALVDALESAGYRVELTMCERWKAVYSSTPEFFQWSVILKKCEEPLEIDRLAFAMISPAMTRRIGFRLKDRTEDGDFWAGQSQGTPAELEESEIPEGTIHFPCLHLHRAAQAMQTAKGLLAKLSEGET